MPEKLRKVGFLKKIIKNFKKFNLTFMVKWLGAQTPMLYKEGIWRELEERKIEIKGVLEELRARNDYGEEMRI